MKKILIILTIMLSSFCSSQNMNVEYAFIDNFQFKTTKSILNFNSKKSTYVNYIKRKKSSSINEKNMSINLFSEKIDNYIIQDIKEPNINSFDNLNKTTYKISEKKPEFNWKIDKTETKKIGKYNCNKATMSFRGRNYIAWFTQDIPTAFGPWKFNGLPGLILEVYDESNTYKWTALKVKLNNKKIQIPYNEFKKITLKKFIELKKKDIEKLRAKIRRALPRGANHITPNEPRKSIEVKYEWEE